MLKFLLGKALVVRTKVSKHCSDGLAHIKADVGNRVFRQLDQVLSKEVIVALLWYMVLDLSDEVDGLDAKHKPFVACKLIKLRHEQAFEPFLVEDALTELYDCVSALLTDHKHRVHQHVDESWFDLCRECVSADI